MSLATLRLADVALHNTSSDAYIVIDAVVYDVTRFLSLHPGGRGCSA